MLGEQPEKSLRQDKPNLKTRQNQNKGFLMNNRSRCHWYYSCSLIGLLALATGALSHADTLLGIYEQSLANDATLKAAEATYKANLEVEKLALSALLPQVTAIASYSGIDVDTTSQRLEEDVGQPPSVVSATTNLDTRTKTYGASLQQSLLDLPAWFTFKSGQQTSEQAIAQFAADQQTLIISVATAYFNVLQALDDLEASRAEEQSAKRQLEQTQQRFDVGLVAISDVYEARASYDNVVVQRLTDEGNVGTSYQELTVLTGLPHDDLWRLSKDFPTVDPDPLERNAWVAFALKNNYSLKAAYYGMQAAKKNATAKKMQHLPRITGSVNYTDNDTDGHLHFTKPFNSKLPQDAQSDGTTWSIDLSLPLFTGGFLSAQRRQAHEQYNSAFQDRISTERNVVQSTRASHITLLNDVKRVAAQKQTIVSTNSALNATQAGYEVGTRDILDVLQARQSLYDAIRNYSAARYNYVLSYLSLKQAAGTLSPEDIFYINQWLVSPDSPAASPFADYFH